MELSTNDREKIADWLQKKCGVMRCTCCGFAKWELAPMATLPIVFDLRSTRFFYAQGIPQVSVACLNCGHFLLFNPAIMGIKPDEPSPATVATDLPPAAAKA